LNKGSKDSDSSVVSNENFSDILWPSSWALGQVTLAKMAQKLLHLWCDSQNNATPNQKIIFRVQTSAIGGGTMALVKQPKTAGFRLISRYDILVDRLSRC